MLYLFSGDDTEKRNAAHEAFLKTLKGAEIFPIAQNDFDLAQIRNFYSGTNLFAARSAIVFNDILENEELKDAVLAELPAMGESENAFIFLERKLLKAVMDVFKKARAEINVFEAPKEKSQKFNSFSIANAFAMKDKLHTWFYFRQAIEAGVELEPISGILFWKMKDMLLKRNFGKFKEEELQDLAARISYLLPQARKKGPEAESAMEQFLLEAF